MLLDKTVLKKNDFKTTRDQNISLVMVVFKVFFFFFAKFMFLVSILCSSSM